jgi:hypothetical protein
MCHPAKGSPDLMWLVILPELHFKKVLASVTLLPGGVTECAK